MTAPAEFDARPTIAVVNTFLDAVERMNGEDQRNACADAIVKLAMCLPARVAGAVLDLIVSETGVTR